MGRKAATKSDYDATASAIGYLYQSRLALLWALKQDDPDVIVSIEKLDDVAFSKLDGNAVVRPFDLRQVKHHLDRKAGLGNKSVDIWKTLRIWSEAIKAKTVDLAHTSFFMVTTSNASGSHAIRYLSPDTRLRDPAKAQELLEKAGDESDATKVKKAHESLMKLSQAARKNLFKSIYLLDGSHDASELRRAIEKEVRLLTDPAHREAFTDRLEGWWFRTVIEHLMEPNSPGIYVRQLEDEIHELREQFRRENLPDDFLMADVPASETSEKDKRHFVHQLRLIEAADPRIQSAQEDHYRAFEQRSQWVRQHLLGMDELHRLETRLIDEWRRRFEIMLEGLPEFDGEWRLVQSGQGLYEWVELSAPSDPALFLRPEFQSKYMTRGSYQMLADQLRVGWHPEFKERLSDGSDKENAEEEDGAR
jgi:hypothetical protein